MVNWEGRGGAQFCYCAKRMLGNFPQGVFAMIAKDSGKVSVNSKVLKTV